MEYAHVIQYISCFLFGMIAYRNKWLDRIPHRVGLTWLLLGICIAVLRYSTDWIPYAGGGAGAEAFVYAVTETAMCYGLCVGLIYFFIEGSPVQTACIGSYRKTATASTSSIFRFS
ncbi:hypothetical protein [Paenibacillus hexagrammi]|uniref:Uncharacterized protein n=1 Tax=Paenibacillus hexagrammi TaxID=2908839 RepID=A0ABY3SI09_9BACL|nr:hypothetical protein [Paenibacillus sp. YPD9-1]UJF33596.1 hypothetical protein L0M14_29610 [Paenibacillus sp. YPD9-1]